MGYVQALYPSHGLRSLALHVAQAAEQACLKQHVICWLGRLTSHRWLAIHTNWSALSKTLAATMVVLAVRVVIRDVLAASHFSLPGRQIVGHIPRHQLSYSACRPSPATIRNLQLFYFELFTRSSGTPASKCFCGTKWLRGGARALSLGITQKL